jgi:hypothetical protein
MSFVDLDEHPNKHSLMRRAFTLMRGVNDGEYLRECNPEYQQQLKDAAAEIQKAKGNG